MSFQDVCRVCSSDVWGCVETGWAAPGGTGRVELQGVTAQHVEAARQSNTHWLEACTIRLLCVLALDRFCDFTSDQVGHSLVQCLTTGSSGLFCPVNLLRWGMGAEREKHPKSPQHQRRLCLEHIAEVCTARLASI